MSADNYIAVRRIGSKWNVWMVLGGYEESEWMVPRGATHRMFDNELEAHHYAHDVCANEVVEYGVALLDAIGLRPTPQQDNE